MTCTCLVLVKETDSVLLALIYSQRFLYLQTSVGWIGMSCLYFRCAKMYRRYIYTVHFTEDCDQDIRRARAGGDNLTSMSRAEPGHSTVFEQVPNLYIFVHIGDIVASLFQIPFLHRLSPTNARIPPCTLTGMNVSSLLANE